MPDLKLGLNDKIGLEKESQIKARPTKRCLLPAVYIDAGNFCLFAASTLVFVCFRYFTVVKQSSWMMLLFTNV
jgi:hypothetical protein